MTTITLKKKISQAMDGINDDEFLKGIYTIMHNKLKEKDNDYSDEIKTELDRRYELIKSGKAKFYTPEETRKKILKNLSK